MSTASQDFALGWKDGRDMRQVWTREETESAIKRIRNDLATGMQSELRAYWIGYLAGLEGRPPLFTQTTERN